MSIMRDGLVTAARADVELTERYEDCALEVGTSDKENGGCRFTAGASKFGNVKRQSLYFGPP
jgi:hypothetical protein